MGPEASLEYYNQFIARAKEDNPEGRYPEIVIYNLNFEDFCRPVSEGKHDQVIELLREKLTALERAGADFAMMASNTPHLYFDRLESETSIPILSIVESSAAEASRRGLDKVALLGTDFTMNSDFYPEEFARHGIEVVVPNEGNRQLVHDKIMNELVEGKFRESTKNELIEVIHGLKEKESVNGVILGCTELPLMLSEDELEVSVLDTTQIHVEAGYEKALEG